MTLRYGLDGSEPLTRKDVSQAIGKSRSAVGTIEQRTIKEIEEKASNALASLAAMAGRLSVTAREALLRIALRAIAEGHADHVGVTDIAEFLHEVERDSPELLVSCGLKSAGRQDQLLPDVPRRRPTRHGLTHLQRKAKV